MQSQMTLQLLVQGSHLKNLEHEQWTGSVKAANRAGERGTKGFCQVKIG